MRGCTTQKKALIQLRYKKFLEREIFQILYFLKYHCLLVNLFSLKMLKLV